jgi:hypothetical protein
VAYFFGGRFQLWLAEHYGEEALIDYHRAFAADPIPYFTYLPAQLAFDASLEGLWIAFQREMKEDAELTLSEVRSATLAVTVPTRLTHYGGDVAGPRISPDGKSILFAASSPVDGNRIHRIPIAGGADEILVNDAYSKQIAFNQEGTAFYFQQTQIFTQRHYEHNSILRFDLAARSMAPVVLEEADRKEFAAPFSGELRARDPDLSPDGRRLVFVQTPAGANRLVVAWLEQDGVTIHPKVIVPAEPDVQLSNPRFSPDGTRIAAARFKGGRRDIVIYDLEGRVALELTRDRAQDGDPTWSLDGRWLIFASDRSGIYNLYGYRLETEQLFQLTNLVSGAFEPSLTPDMKTLVFRGYSSEGFDVYTTPFDPEHATRVSLARMPAEGPEPAAIDDHARRWPETRPDVPPLPPPAPPSGAPLPEKLPPDWSFGSYSSLDTILPFHDNWNLLPTLSANEREIFGTLTHFGSDALGTQSYALSVDYGTLSRYVGGAALYQNDMLEPTFTLAAGTSALDYEYVNAARTGFLDYFERRNTVLVGVAQPVGGLNHHLLSLSYSFEDRSPLRALSPELRQANLPLPGHYARITLGYSYSNVRSFPYSISLERGVTFSLSLDGLSKGLGSDYEQILANAEGRAYLDLPWVDNHVLASRLAISAGGGPDLAESFRLGGVGGQSALTTLSANFFPLRGVVTYALVGPGQISGSFEYRAPILRIERGPGTLPLVLRVLHAAAFFDYGRVFARLNKDSFTSAFFDPFALGAGLEVRADILAGEIPFQLRFGYAKALRVPDPLFDGSGPYFQLGAMY